MNRLHTLSTSGWEQYSEHRAYAQRHHTQANRSRKGNFHQAASAHLSEAGKHRTAAIAIVKNSPSNAGVYSDTRRQQDHFDILKQAARYN